MVPDNPPMHLHHLILELVVLHLSIGDVFRLRRALGAAPAWEDAAIARLLVERDALGYSRQTIASTDTLEALCRRMQGHTRCTECGTPCKRRIRVCKACACDPSCFFALLTRKDILDYAGSRNRCTNVLARVKPAHRAGNNALLYWKRHVDEVLRGLSHPNP